MTIRRVRELVTKEWKTLTRYLLVGGSSFGVNILVYLAISRYFWPEGYKPIINVMAIGVSMIYNYLLHRLWTFRHQQAAAGSVQRYVVVVVAANTLDALVFYILQVKLEIYDVAVKIFNGGFIAVFSFVSHRFFTFHNDPWKKLADRKDGDVVQSG